MEASGRTLVCSVLFLDIVEYTKKPVAEQLQLKNAFNRVLAQALEQVPARDRVILDTGDGAAVTFMGDPEDALFAAMAVREAAGALSLRLGINLGPVRLVKDLNGQLNIIGDGINVAQRVMSFAVPGQLLVARSFYEVVSCLSRDYASLFRHEGERTDKHVRSHDVYSVVGGRPASKRLADTHSEDDMTGAGWLARRGPLGMRRSAVLAAALVFFGLVGGALAARALIEPRAPERAQVAPVETIVIAPPSAAEPVPAPKKVAARAERKAERTASAARLEIAVAPWGEVWVDGKSRGVSPPLRSLDLAPGAHTIEIRNGTFTPHVERVEARAGEALRIRHRFR